MSVCWHSCARWPCAAAGMMVLAVLPAGAGAPAPASCCICCTYQQTPSLLCCHLPPQAAAPNPKGRLKYVCPLHHLLTAALAVLPCIAGSGTNPQEVFFPHNPANLNSDALINQGGAFILRSNGSQAWCRWVMLLQCSALHARDPHTRDRWLPAQCTSHPMFHLHQGSMSLASVRAGAPRPLCCSH